jgi:Fe-S-cluster containining protein
MKETTYLTIIEQFDQWAAQYMRVCSKGCSCCCTENVTITALEGERILRFCMSNGLTQWLAETLLQPAQVSRPRMTTNEFAHACLSGRETVPDSGGGLTVCPFLAEDACRIYPVRPFSCRCFISASRCSATQPALLDESYLTASTAMLQLIEHLGQKEYWGIMTDVLMALLDISTYQPVALAIANPERIMAGRLRTLTARPLPGFLFTEEEERLLLPLLQSIFSSRIGSVTVEDVLNGRGIPSDNQEVQPA